MPGGFDIRAITSKINEDVTKAITKNLTAKVDEALDIGTPPAEVIENLNKILPIGQQAVQGPAGMGGAIVGKTEQGGNVPAQNEQQQAQELLGQLIQGGVVDQQPQQPQQPIQPQAPVSAIGQEVEPESNQPPGKKNEILKAILKSLALGGATILNPNAFDQFQDIEKLRTDKETATQDQKFKANLENFKQNRLDRRESLKAQLKSSGDVDDLKKASLTAAGSLVDIVDLRQSIGLRGPVGGRVGGLLGAFGVGTESRAEFDSAVNQFVFDIGATLGQKGKAFTQQEQELVRKKITQASLSAKQSDFDGRMNAIIKRINRSAGEEILPNIKNLKSTLKASKNQIGQAPQQVETSTGRKFIIKQRGQ